MEQKEKIKIVDLLKVYISNKGSQNKASASLKGVSPAVISHLLSGHWEPYSDDMFRKIGNQIGYNSQNWQFVETENARTLFKDLDSAKQSQSVLTFLAPAGSGKSEITKQYAKENSDVIRIECAGHWDDRYFLQKLLKEMGVKNPHNKVPFMVEEVIDCLTGYDTPPLLILDEVDKLKDPLLWFLITFYNELKWKCGIVLFSTYYFKKRIDDGVRVRKKGYEELQSRYGTYIEFEQTSALDVKKLCEGQGISDTTAISKIQKNCKGDLRIASETIRILKTSKNV